MLALSAAFRLTLLAPDIQEIILDGGQPKDIQLEELTKAMPSEWTGQLSCGPCPYNIGCARVTGAIAFTRDAPLRQHLSQPARDRQPRAGSPIPSILLRYCREAPPPSRHCG